MQATDRLLGLLRRRGLVSGGEIRQGLGISQPTLSRLVRAAGPQVLRFGRSVATRYALPREIAGIGRSSPVSSLAKGAAMDESRSWEIIQSTCQSDPDRADEWAEGLTAALMKLEPGEIIEWGRLFDRFAAQANSWDLWGLPIGSTAEPPMTASTTFDAG